MFSFAQIRKLLTLSVIAVSIAGLHNCAKNTVGKQATTETNVYENPASVNFTSENYAFMLRSTYNNFTLTPSLEDMDSILNASDDDAAKEAYEAAIDKLIDSGDMGPKFKLIGREMLGMAIVKNREEQSRYPENLFAYLIDQGLPISEFILAEYVIRDNGTRSNGLRYTDQSGTAIGPPVGEQAGFTTYEEWLTLYMNSFGFKLDREIIGINLCDVAPYSKFDSYAWKLSEVNNTYRVADDGTSCFNCHAKKQPLRGAWHYFNPNNRAWNPGVNGTQGNDQYGQEAFDAGKSTLEPRDENDNFIPEGANEATAKKYYRFKENGNPILTPRSLALEIVKEPRFATCWTERFLAILLNLDQGHPGQGFVPPNNFAANDAQVEYLNKWTEKFNEKGQIPKEWMREFLKDPDYLILSYSPSGNN